MSISRRAPARSKLPALLKKGPTEPKFIVPSVKVETFKPDRPSKRYSMALPSSWICGSAAENRPPEDYQISSLNTGHCSRQAATRNLQWHPAARGGLLSPCRCGKVRGRDPKSFVSSALPC